MLDRSKIPRWTKRAGWRGGSTETLYTWTWRPYPTAPEMYLTTYGTIFRDGTHAIGYRIDAPERATVKVATIADARAASWGRNWTCADGVTT